MSDLTDKLVEAVQKGQLDFGQVVSRLTPEEKQEFSDSLQRYSQAEVDREDSALGANKWLARGAMGAGALGGALLAPEAIGGAGMASQVGPLAAGGAAAVQNLASKYPIAAGLGTYLVGKLMGLPPELRDITSIMVGSRSPAGAVAGPVAGEAEDALAGLRTKTPPMTDAEYTAATGKSRLGSVQRRAPNPPNLSNEAGMDDIETRVRGGGGVAFEHDGETVRPNGPISQKGSSRPGQVQRRSPSDAIGEDEADKRKVLFGGANVKTDISKKSDIYNTSPNSKALQDLVEGRNTNFGPPAGMTERRMDELLKLFGGTKR